MLDKLRAKRETLYNALRESIKQVEQIRGAIAVTEELIAELEGDGLDARPSQS